MTHVKARKADLWIGHGYSCSWWPGDSSISGHAALTALTADSSEQRPGSSPVPGSSPHPDAKIWRDIHRHCWPLGFPWATALSLAPELAQGFAASLARVSLRVSAHSASRTQGVTSSPNALDYTPRARGSGRSLWFFVPQPCARAPSAAPGSVLSLAAGDLI